VEGALRVLCREGVYLTSDEFKGRSPIRRGSLALSITQQALRNPVAAVHLLFHTSGRTGQMHVVGIDLSQMRHEAVGLRLFFDARGGARWVHAIYGVPGSSIIRVVMRVASIGAPLVRWFSQLDPAAHELGLRYRWSARLMSACGVLAGVPIPSPEHVPLEHPRRIASWLADTLARGQIPNLWSYTSSAVRICEDAVDAGIRLDGAQLTLLGEPLTATRLAAIRRAGVFAASYYSSVDSGHIAYACQSPAHVDDLHVLHDQYAVIHPSDCSWSSPLPSNALLITTMNPTTPFVMLNVSLGDQGMIEERRCGCHLEQLGWTTHLHTIRGYEKVTVGGMTLRDADVIAVLEEILPSRFGGAPTHYQLIEDEDQDGHPRLRLLVHPALGPVDAEAVAETFLTAIGSGAGPDRVVELAWRGGRFLQVERTPPRAVSGGKILHLLDARKPRTRQEASRTGIR
jgi:hypothetical protein